MALILDQWIYDCAVGGGDQSFGKWAATSWKRRKLEGEGFGKREKRS